MAQFNFVTKSQAKRSLPWSDYNDYDHNRYNQIRVANKVLSDGVTINDVTQLTPRAFSRDRIDKSLEREDVAALRQISQFFYRKSGIYERLCNYMAAMYRYDWFLVPQIYDQKLISTEPGKKKIMEGWWKASKFLDNCNL